MKRLVLSVAIIVVSVFCLQVKGDLLVDQKWESPDPYIGGGGEHSLALNQPLGQEFTPTVNNIAGVSLAISASYLNRYPGDVQDITVNIRGDVISGNILTSKTFAPTVDTDFIDLLSNEPYFVWMYFDFDEQTPVTPGNRYLIEVSVPELGSLNWMWKGWTDTYDVGVPGNSIISGERANSTRAFGFLTYFLTPEPATLSLFALGCFLLHRKRTT